jgi:ribose transport system permease protein
MSVQAVTAGRSSLGSARGWLRDRPVVPLLLLLAILVVALQVVRPGIVSADFASSTVRFAVPLAILAACQTLTMLTGGIDLSVAVVASMTS